MQEFNIVRLLSDCSFDCIIGAGIACVIIFVFKRFLKASTKICLGLAFIIGAAATASISAFLLKESAEVAATKAVTAGGVAAVLTAFMKKFAFTDKEELKSNIEKLLSSIVLSDELDKVVDEIIVKILDKGCGSDEIKSVILDNLSEDIDDESLDKVCAFIMSSIEKHKQNKSDKKNN